VTSRSAPILTLLLCLYVLVSTSCLARRRVISRNGGARQTLQVADKQALVDRVAETYKVVHDISATVDMTPALGSAEKAKITEYKDVRGYVLFRKSSDIRIIGLYPVVRNKAFDMVSDAEAFKLYIPGRNRFVTGRNEIIEPSANRIENLRPQHFLEALLVRPPGENEEAVLQNLTDEETAHYILHLLARGPDGELRLSRSIWFDRGTLALTRQLAFDEAGNILSDARYREWQNWDGVPFPRQVEINRPRDEYAVVLRMVKLDINKGLTDEQFVLEQPAGTTLQVLGATPAAAVSTARSSRTVK
jgi:outer membrane lipoprotein-sorting protein